MRFVPGSELSSDGRLWALLMRMLYQRDEASVYHALRAMSHLGAKPESLQTLRAARRMPAIMNELARSPHPKVAAAALQVCALLPSTAEAAAGGGGGGRGGEPRGRAAPLFRRQARRPPQAAGARASSARRRRTCRLGLGVAYLNPVPNPDVQVRVS